MKPIEVNAQACGVCKVIGIHRYEKATLAEINEIHNKGIVWTPVCSTCAQQATKHECLKILWLE